MSHLQRLLHSPRLHGLAALSYSVLIVAYLLQQPGAPTVEIVAPVAAPDWRREVAFTIGHIIGFGVLFALWFAALRHIAPGRAAVGAFVVAMLIGLTAETLQSLLPDRSASLYDVTMNTIGMMLAWCSIERLWLQHKNSRPC